MSGRSVRAFLALCDAAETLRWPSLLLVAWVVGYVAARVWWGM